jgi:hypothetical protein
MYIILVIAHNNLCYLYSKTCPIPVQKCVTNHLKRRHYRVCCPTVYDHNTYFLSSPVCQSCLNDLYRKLTEHFRPELFWRQWVCQVADHIVLNYEVFIDFYECSFNVLFWTQNKSKFSLSDKVWLSEFYQSIDSMIVRKLPEEKRNTIWLQ